MREEAEGERKPGKRRIRGGEGGGGGGGEGQEISIVTHASSRKSWSVRGRGGGRSGSLFVVFLHTLGLTVRSQASWACC
eukprot:763439-Hanusia_phi.AAC.2